MIERATAAFQLPVSPVRPIKDVMRSPIKTRVSFVGHLVSVSNQVFIKKLDLGLHMGIRFSWTLTIF